MKALTRIVHGTGKKGEEKVFEPGQSVSGLKDNELEALKEAGAVGDQKEYDKLTEEGKQAEIARLQAELAELGYDAGSPTPPSPGEAAHELAKREAELKEREDALAKKEADAAKKSQAQN